FKPLLSLSGLRLLQVFSHAVEHAVDELHGFGAGEFAGNLDGLVDHDSTRRVGISKKLRYGSAQDVAIDGGHALHAAVLRGSFDEGINVDGAVGGGSKQVIRKASYFITHFVPFRPERAADVIGALAAHVCLKKHLQNKFARFASSAHGQSLLVSGWSRVKKVSRSSLQEERFVACGSSRTQEDLTGRPFRE